MSDLSRDEVRDIVKSAMQELLEQREAVIECSKALRRQITVLECELLAVRAERDAAKGALSEREPLVLRQMDSLVDDAALTAATLSKRVAELETERAFTNSATHTCKSLSDRLVTMQERHASVLEYAQLLATTLSKKLPQPADWRPSGDLYTLLREIDGMIYRLLKDQESVADLIDHYYTDDIGCQCTSTSTTSEGRTVTDAEQLLKSAKVQKTIANVREKNFVEKPPTPYRNASVLDSFIAYCEAHPSERFWQALRNWSGEPSIYAGDPGELKDTFYREGRGRRDE